MIMTETEIRLEILVFDKDPINFVGICIGIQLY